MIHFGDASSEYDQNSFQRMFRISFQPSPEVGGSPPQKVPTQRVPVHSGVRSLASIHSAAPFTGQLRSSCVVGISWDKRWQVWRVSRQLGGRQKRTHFPAARWTAEGFPFEVRKPPNPKPETRNPKPKTRNPKPETQNPKP